MEKTFCSETLYAKSIMVFTSFLRWLALAGEAACAVNQNHIHLGLWHTCTGSAHPMIYKRLSHRSGQIKGLEKGNKLTGECLASLKDLILKAAVFIKQQCIIMFL